VPALVVVLVIGYFATARRDDSGAITGGGTLSVQDLRVGDCFNSEDADEIAEVDARPCSEPHEYELFHDAEHPGPSYPTDEAWFTFIVEECTPAFEEYVGIDFDSSSLDIQPLTPTEGGWDDGDRVLQCIAVDPNDSTLTTSLRNANR
jgi:hypothetical protein